MFAKSDKNERGSRAASPWDSLVSISTPSPSSSPSPSMSLSPSPPQSVSFPKLVPESDYGHIEYKLQLLSPSPSRFARLVTQLKWRLLEGNGQAYYELGVADSGLLVGLTQADMDSTLMTLEEMAGEIGASVIIVKEVEVPKDMIGIEEPGGDWSNRRGTSKRRRKRRDLNLHSGEESTTTTEDDCGGFTPDYATPNFHSQSDSALDSDLSLFSMDPEPEYESDGDSDSDAATVANPVFTVDLAISTVYKPRPVRKRVQVSLKGKTKREKEKGTLLVGSRSTTEFPSLQNTPSQPTMTKQDTKALHRRVARDRRRDNRRKQLEGCSGPDPVTSPLADARDSGPALAEDVATLVPQFETLTVNSPDDLPTLSDADITVPAINEPPVPPNEEDDDDVFPSTPTPQKTTLNGEESEKRIIVEALVVRKMSLEEGSLDFGGFALEL